MRYPPQTEDLEKLSRFFDRLDTTELAELEEVSNRPAFAEDGTYRKQGGLRL